MDAKALAKSKRAHSLHHSKKPSHSSLKSKAPSGGANNAGGGNKALGKQTKEKARQSGLPANWDRYEEEFDSDSEVPSGDSISKASDVILPKSKGADFRHLIAEAQSQCQSNVCLDTFPSMDDILPGDFELGVRSMLSVRGEGILSWTGDDNFVVEDETTAIPEASFFSLNLNALAEQLAKVDISKRLYIEEDLLPPELTDNRSKASCGPESDQMQTSETEATSMVAERLAFRDISGKNKVANKNTEVISSESTANRYSNLISPNQGLDRLNQAKGDQYSSRDSKFSESKSQKSQADSKKKLSTFEAAAAEAELDMLLDSFSETNFLDSSAGLKSSSFPVSQKEAPVVMPQFTRNTSSSTSLETTAVAAKLDDVLDGLLDETTNLSNQNSSCQLGKVTVTHNEIKSSSSSQPVTKSIVLDDFDSWLDTL
ncbi:hypothetical protein JCGZ_25729 [Jatropha curcas]|uniref:Uncharacterized protein n=1 Tax=Jatropha curcas TaxID=180498 RepID=A0A067JJK1_JATCU|nr:uncharacterized protein LOC105646878 [Jatropha curcas]KDP24072.1 hypothetical protein JCGZ_25729 [Jatropha curcas]